MAGCGADCGASSAAGNTGVAGRAARTIIAGRMPTFPNRGCTAWYSPMHKPVNPLGGKLSTGKPYAGDPPVRFGGRRDRGNRSFLPLFFKRPSGPNGPHRQPSLETQELWLGDDRVSIHSTTLLIVGELGWRERRSQ